MTIIRSLIYGYLGAILGGLVVVGSTFLIALDRSAST